MTKEQFAAQMGIREIGDEISTEAEKVAKQCGLLVVFGYSDDTVEFCGLFRDERSAGDSTTFRMDEVGILKSWEQVVDEGADEKEAERYFASKGKGKEMTAFFDEGNVSWTFKTTIPHATFNVMDGGEIFCIGLVIERKDLE